MRDRRDCTPRATGRPPPAPVEATVATFGSCAASPLPSQLAVPRTWQTHTATHVPTRSRPERAVHHERDGIVHVHRRQLGLAMPGRPDAKHLVHEPLTDLVHAAEIQHG